MKMYYSTTEAAKILGYSSGVVVRVYIHQGVMKGTKLGRNWYIDYRELKTRQARLKLNKEKREKAKV